MEQTIFGVLKKDLTSRQLSAILNSKNRGGEDMIAIKLEKKKKKKEPEKKEEKPQEKKREETYQVPVDYH